LFREVLKKNGKKEEDYGNIVLLGQFSAQMLKKYSFDRRDLSRKAGIENDILLPYAEITQDMYDWALENIKL
jgi:hypothetical protein